MEAAHEVAGPLSAVRAALDLLGQHIDGADARDLLDLARRQLGLADMRVSRFAQLDVSPAPPTRVPTDVVELCRTLVDDLSTSILEGHPAHVEACGSLRIEVDPDQIRQVLFNLLSNAARYSPAGRDIVVAVTVDASSCEIRIRDQGAGVAPEDTERIFERYERGDVDVRGTGIGLAVARGLARGHGGDLVLEPAEDGPGSTFLLRLPVEGS
jgi:two-component system, OmpR family, sensor kinase